MSRRNLTGKQQQFVAEYLGPAKFNATLAAVRAGYKATSKHSFEAIGSENLTRPNIANAISEYFRMSRMSAEEVLQELTGLARGNTRDKIKALALLATHHSLLDGKWTEKEGGPLEITIKHVREQAKQEGWDECVAELNKDIDKYNTEALESNNRKDAQWQAIIDRYQNSPEAVEALTLLRDVMLKGKELEPRQQDYKIIKHEIVPPQRRLEAAPVERMMAEVVSPAEPEYIPPPPAPPKLCRHGYTKGSCHVIDVGKDQCEHWYKHAHTGSGFMVA